jgi:Ca2+-binding EF-hand superfamily protein
MLNIYVALNHLSVVQSYLQNQKLYVMNKKWLMVIMLVSMFTTVQSFAQEGKQDRPKGDPDKMFKALDTDADGKLSKAEVEKAQRGRLKDNFEAIDTNKDSFLDKTEITAYREKQKSERKSANRK